MHDENINYLTIWQKNNYFSIHDINIKIRIIIAQSIWIGTRLLCLIFFFFSFVRLLQRFLIFQRMTNSLSFVHYSANPPKRYSPVYSSGNIIIHLDIVGKMFHFQNRVRRGLICCTTVTVNCWDTILLKVLTALSSRYISKDPRMALNSGGFSKIFGRGRASEKYKFYIFM